MKKATVTKKGMGKGKNWLVLAVSTGWAYSKNVETSRI